MQVVVFRCLDNDVNYGSTGGRKQSNETFLAEFSDWAGLVLVISLVMKEKAVRILPRQFNGFQNLETENSGWLAIPDPM